MSRLFNRKSVLIGGVVAVIAAAGAYAYFTQTGSGTGTASTGSGSAIVVVQTSTITGLTPGSTPQGLSGTFNNPNPGTVHVASVTASISSVTDVAGDPITGCANDDYAIASATATVPQEIAAGNAHGSWSGPTIAMVDKTTTNQDACKGAIVHVSYTSA
jgi:hypothetical protein